MAIGALQAGRLVFQWTTSTDGTHEKIILKIFIKAMLGLGALSISKQWLQNEDDNTSRVMKIVRRALWCIGALFLLEGVFEFVDELENAGFFENLNYLKGFSAYLGFREGIFQLVEDSGLKEKALLVVAGITILKIAYRITKIEGAVALIQNLAGIGLTGAMMGKVVANCSIRLRNLLIGRQQGEESFRARALRVALVAAVAFIAGALMATTLQIAPLIGGVMAVAGSILGTRDLAPQRLEQAHQGIAQQFGWSSKKIEILFLGANLGIALMVALKISGMELPFYVLPLVTGALATVNW